MWLVVFILSLMQSEAVTALTDELEKRSTFLFMPTSLRFCIFSWMNCSLYRRTVLFLLCFYCFATVNLFSSF